MNSARLPVPDLAQAGRVNVHAWQIFAVAGVDALDGPIPGLQGDIALRVIDIPHGTGYLVPLAPAHARELAGQLLKYANEHDGQHTIRRGHDANN